MFGFACERWRRWEQLSSQAGSLPSGPIFTAQLDNLKNLLVPLKFSCSYVGIAEEVLQKIRSLILPVSLS